MLFAFFSIPATSVAASSYAEMFQASPVTGTITDANGDGVAGATVRVKETNAVAITGLNGEFTIAAEEGQTLVVSFVGMATQEIPVTSNTNYSVGMTVDAQALDDVVVIGYGTQKKSSFTGSTSKVESEKIDELPYSRVDDALVGQLSGVQVKAVDGEAGSAPEVTVRGVGSLNGDATPLVVVDGIIMDYDFLTNLDMNDVASFEVLKDAASAAIYGSKGANGILMITLKDGVEGKPKISYHGYIGNREARTSDAYTFSLAETAAAELATNGVISDRTAYKQLIGIDRSWQDIIFDGGKTTNHSLSARGGTDKTKYSASLNYGDDAGVLLTDNFEKMGGRLKLTTELNDKLSFGASVSPSFSKRRRFDGSTHDILRQTNWLPLYHDANTIQFVNYHKYPNVQVGDYAIQRHFDDFDLNTMTPVPSGGTDISNTSNTNPAAKVLERERYDNKMKLYGNIFAKYQLMDGLNFTTSFGATSQDTERSRWQGTKSNRNGASAAQMNEITQRKFYTLFDNYLNYNKVINGNHDIAATLGASFDMENSDFSTISGSGYTNDLVKEIANASLITGADSFEWEKNTNSFFGRVNYAYDNKYLAAVSLRRDGSSVFGADNKYGTFPAASIGWNMDQEDFLKDNNVLTGLKLRASYGATGYDTLNTGSSDPDRSSSSSSLSTGDKLIDFYPSLSLLQAVTASVGGSVTPGFTALNISNSDLQWERLIEFNPGIDFSFLQNRFYGSIDYYKRTSDQLLLSNPVSVTTGFNEALVNLGEVQNKGFEFEFRSRNLATEMFQWNSTITTTTNKNELVDFAESNGQITSVDSKRAAEWINLEGMPISTYYGWVVDRDIPTEYLSNQFHPVGGTAQDVYVKDLNGDGLIDDDDKAALGDPYPDLVWSFANDLIYGPVSFSFMLQGSHGAEVRNMGDQYIFNQFNSSQDFTSATPDQGFIKQKIFTNAIIQDASYISLRSANLGYQLPKTLLSNYGISGMRLYATGTNLLFKTADDYTGFNPDSIDKQPPTNYGYQRAGSPIYRTVSFGLNLDF